MKHTSAGAWRELGLCKVLYHWRSLLEMASSIRLTHGPIRGSVAIDAGAILAVMYLHAHQATGLACQSDAPAAAASSLEKQQQLPKIAHSHLLHRRGQTLEHTGHGGKPHVGKCLRKRRQLSVHSCTTDVSAARVIPCCQKHTWLCGCGGSWKKK